MGNVANLVVYGRYFRYSGGQSIYAAGNVTDTAEKVETIRSDDSCGQYSICFQVANDSGMEDFEGGFSTVKWNLNAPSVSGFQGLNGGRIIAILSTSGTQEAEMIGFDAVVWNMVASAGDGIEPEDIIRTDLSFRSGKETSISIGVLPVNAGLINLHITAQGYRKTTDDDPNGVLLEGREGKYISVAVYAARNIIIGNPLQIYKEASFNTFSYSYFGKNDENLDTTIFANNAQGSHIEWFYVDAAGEYIDIMPKQILLNKPEDIEAFSRTSKIIDSIELQNDKSISIGAVNVYPYTVKLKEKEHGAGGFTKVIGRIYYNNDSTQDIYIESEYTIINKVFVEPSNRKLIMKYGENRLLSGLVNDRGTLGWKSYRKETFTGYNKGIMDDNIITISQNKITASNYGDITLQISPIWYIDEWNRWERFDSIIDKVADTIDIHVEPAILRGKTSKNIIDSVEIINVDSSISLSTNIVGDHYRYSWEYLQVEGSGTGTNSKDWRDVTNIDPSEFRFGVIESEQEGSRGFTSITIQGKMNGQVQMRCKVTDTVTGEVILDNQFTIKIVDTMTLSETRKMLAVGGTLDIEAYISGMGSDTVVEWSVVDSEYCENIRITSIGATTARVEGVAETNNSYVTCRAIVELNGTIKSATFYVMVLPAIDGVRIEVSPSRVISVGGSAALDLIIDPDVTTSFTKDQIKWVVKDFVFQDGTSIDASTIIRKEDSTSNVLQTTVTGLAPGEAYVVAVINDSAQTEIAVITIKVVTKVEGLQLNKKEHTLFLPSGNEDAQNRSTFLLIATPLPKGVVDSEELGIEWYASNNTVTVTPDPENPMQALVTAHAIGSVQVMANVAGLPAIADFCTFTVENPAEEIQLDPAGPYQLRVGETRLVTPILTPAEVTNTSVIWTIENEQIATVSQSGVITGVSFGSTFVTCTTSNGISIQYPVTVFDSAQTVVPAVSGAKIKASPSSVISVGDTVQLDLILDTTETSLTKDQIKWVVKGVDGQGDPETIIEKTDGDNLFQTTITGRSVGEAYVAAVINDSVQTEIAITTIKVLPNVKAIELNTHEVKGKLSESVVLTATLQPKGYADIKNLKMEWIGIPENGSITITPDPNDPLKAVVTFHKAGTVYVMAQVSDMPRIADLCKFEILSARPSNNKDKENDERNNTTNQNTASDSDLTNSEQNRVEAALGSHIVIQTVVKNNAGKLVVTVGREVVFCEKDGSLSKEKWQSVDGVWYYFGSDSKAVDGWLKTGNQWYYMNQNNKQMETGWIQTADGKWYLLDERNGDMQTGWQQRGGKWYLLDGINGDMKTDWQLKDGKWYLLDRMNGDMKIGWQMVNGKWYYLTESGAMAANTITPDGYQVDGSGVWIP